MKFRSDFVTNSSSSSFIISKNDLTKKQLKMLLDYNVYSGRRKWGDEWEIEDHEDQIYCFTIMDNGDMKMFLKKIKVNLDNVRYIEEMV